MSFNVISLHHTTRNNEEFFAIRSWFEADAIKENASTGNERNLEKSKHKDKQIAF